MRRNPDMLLNVLSRILLLTSERDDITFRVFSDRLTLLSACSTWECMLSFLSLFTPRYLARSDQSSSRL